MSVLAIDLGGSHVGCAVVEGGRVLASSSLATDARRLADLLPELKRRLLAHCRALGIEPAGCTGLGIGFPAIVDSERGEILSTLSKFADGNGAALQAWSARELGLTARIENDAKLALLGEHYAGAARDFEDVVMVTLGTGIGVAAMLQNRLLHSRIGQAGLLGGHLSVDFGGRPCACGAIGCAEAEASTSTLAAICRGWPGFQASLLAREAQLDFATLFRCKDAEDAHDAVAREIVAHCIHVWSALTVSLIHAYGPQLVLFGGGVMNRSDQVLPAIRAYVDRHSWKTSRGTAAIEAASLGESAALIGAEALFAKDCTHSTGRR